MDKIHLKSRGTIDMRKQLLTYYLQVFVFIRQIIFVVFPRQGQSAEHIVFLPGL